MLKVTNEDHFFHVKQHFPTTVSKHLWFGLKELSKMVMTTFPLIQGLGRPQIIILNHVSVYNRSVKHHRSLLLQASSSFTIELWEDNIINSWVVGGFSPPIWKTCYTQIGNHFPNFFLMNIPEIFWHHYPLLYLSPLSKTWRNRYISWLTNPFESGLKPIRSNGPISRPRWGVARVLQLLQEPGGSNDYSPEV